MQLQGSEKMQKDPAVNILGEPLESCSNDLVDKHILHFVCPSATFSLLHPAMSFDVLYILQTNLM